MPDIIDFKGTREDIGNNYIGIGFAQSAGRRVDEEEPKFETHGRYAFQEDRFLISNAPNLPDSTLFPGVLADLINYAALYTSSKDAEKRYNEGSTATLALVDTEKKLHIAWLADSPVVLYIRDDATGKFVDAKKVTKDHNFSNRDERIRAVKTSPERYDKSFIDSKDDHVALTRYLGGNKNRPKTASATPETKTIDLSEYIAKGQSVYVAVSCDGLYEKVGKDNIRPEAHLKKMNEWLQKNPNLSSEDLARNMVQFAYDGGSYDNLTMVIVPVTAESDIKKPILVSMFDGNTGSAAVAEESLKRVKEKVTEYNNLKLPELFQGKEKEVNTLLEHDWFSKKFEGCDFVSRYYVPIEKDSKLKDSLDKLGIESRNEAMEPYGYSGEYLVVNPDIKLKCIPGFDSKIHPLPEIENYLNKKEIAAKKAQETDLELQVLKETHIDLPVAQKPGAEKALLPNGISPKLAEQARAIATDGKKEKIDLSKYNLPHNDKHKAQFAKVEIDNGDGEKTQRVRISVSADLHGKGNGRKTIIAMAKELKEHGYEIEKVITKNGKMVDIGHSYAKNKDGTLWKEGQVRKDSKCDMVKTPYHPESYQLTVSGNPEKLQALIDKLSIPGKKPDSINQKESVKWTGVIKENRSNPAILK